MENYFLKVLESSITTFEKDYLVPYCTSHNLPLEFSSLFVREEENFPPSINILLGNKVPKYLLYNSKSFLKFYKTLDEDFKNEIVRDSFEIKKIRAQTLLDVELQKLIKNKLGKDTDVY